MVRLRKTYAPCAFNSTGVGATLVLCNQMAEHGPQTPNHRPPEMRYRQNLAPWGDRQHPLRFVHQPRCHFLHRAHDLILGHNIMMQPVRDVLRRNTTGCAVFHQTNVVDV